MNITLHTNSHVLDHLCGLRLAAIARYCSLSSAAALGVVASGGCTVGNAEEAPSTGIVSQELHTAAGKGICTDAVTLALLSGHGNWCDRVVPSKKYRSGPGDPVDCWDFACRQHDYAYGRIEDGRVSCHRVTNVHGLHDKSCTDAADRALCDAWDSCQAQYEAAYASSHYWAKGLRPTDGLRRNCPKQPGVRGRPRQPVFCSWLGTYTCEPCPMEPAWTPPTGTDCSLPLTERTESAAEQKAQEPASALACCAPGTPAESSIFVNCSPVAGIGEVCEPRHAIPLNLDCRSHVQVTYHAPERHCTNVRIHVFLDGGEVAISDFVPPNGNSGPLDLGELEPGSHTVELAAERNSGGCGSDVLESWSGEVTVTLSGEAASP